MSAPPSGQHEAVEESAQIKQPRPYVRQATLLNASDGLIAIVPAVRATRRPSQKEAAAFGDRDVTADYVYMWVDGIHLKVRL